MKLSALSLVVILFLQLSCGQEGYFWHFTDLHWDFSYPTTAALSCTVKNISERGPFGNYFCDSPWILIEEVIKGAQKLRPDVDFILWTGDTSPHIRADYMSTDIVINQIFYITQLIKEYFPDVPIYPTLGNHDYYPKDQFPPRSDKIYSATYSMWKTWIGDGAPQQTFNKGGYYTVKTKYGLRIIAMNSNFYYNDNVTKDLDDPADQFAWLDDQLSGAASRSEKVIITGHVPPGVTPPHGDVQMFPNFNDQFVKTVLRHSDVIAALHFGHEHHDNFRLFLNSSGQPVVPLFVAPSVTPISLPMYDEPIHNPGVRLIKYNRKFGWHLDILQYYVDLPMANRAIYVNLALGYVATEEYEIPDIRSDSLAVLVDKFQNQTGPYFQRFMKWYTTNAVESYPCNATCHKSVVCGIRYQTEQEFAVCMSKLERQQLLQASVV